MASNQTANFGLSQWEATDKVLREEFNADNAKIDAALAGMPKIITGTYAGDGSASRLIELGATPKAVYVCTQYGASYTEFDVYSTHLGGLAITGHPCQIKDSPIVSVSEGGFTVYAVPSNSGKTQRAASNLADQTYHYIAFC